MDTVIGIILIAAAVFLIVAILLQEGKDKGLAGAIGGGSSDTYFGKNKGSSRDKIMDRLTLIIAIVFALLVLVSFIIQKDVDIKPADDTGTTAAVTTAAGDETGADTTADTGDVTDAGSDTTATVTDTSATDTTSADQAA